MSKKTSVPLRIAPLQCIIAEPITDPAEQAALDLVRKREKRKKGQNAKLNHKDASTPSNSAAKRRG